MKQRTPRVGLLLIGARRFLKLGEGTERGNYRQRKERDAARMTADLETRMDVVFPGVIYEQEDIYRAIDAFVQAKVDCVLAIYLSWTEDFTWVRFLRDMPPIPILYAHCVREQVNLSDTHDEDEFAEFMCCGGLVGILQGSGDNARFARPMLENAIGTWRELLDQFETFARAACVRAQLLQSNAGLLASFNEVMWSTYVDPYAVFQVMGPELKFLSVSQLCDCIDAVPDAEVAQAAARLSEKYEVQPDVEQDKFLASIRATLGMENLASENGIDLLVLNDVDKVLLTKVGLRPGFYPLHEKCETIIVPEGDVGAGLAAYILHLITGGHVHYIEPFHIDRATDTFEAGHAGPNDYTHPDGKTKIARDVRFAKTDYRYAGAPFAWHVFPEGVMTMLGCVYRDGKFHFSVHLVESLPCELHLASYVHGRLKPVNGTCEALFAPLIRQGVTQHYVLALGDWRREACALARMLGCTMFGETM